MVRSLRAGLDQYQDPYVQAQIKKMLAQKAPSNRVQGLGHILKQGLAGFMMGEDDNQRTAAQEAYATGINTPYSPAVAYKPKVVDPGVSELDIDINPEEYEGIREPGTLNSPGVEAKEEDGPFIAARRGLSELKGNRYASGLLADMGMQQASADRAARIAAGIKAGDRKYAGGVADLASERLIEAARLAEAGKDRRAGLAAGKGTTKEREWRGAVARGETTLPFVQYNAALANAAYGLQVDFKPKGGASQRQPQASSALIPQVTPQAPPANVGASKMPSNILPGSRAAQAWEAGKSRNISAANQTMIANRPSGAREKRYGENVEGIEAGLLANNTLKKALGMSSKAYDGLGAQARAWFVKNLIPEDIMDNAAAIDTGLLTNMVQKQAIGSLKATFGGLPTEGERKILLELQGSADLPQDERDAIWTEAIRLGEIRIKQRRRQAAQYEKTFGKRHWATDEGFGTAPKADPNDPPPVSMGGSGQAPLPPSLPGFKSVER